MIFLTRGWSCQNDGKWGDNKKEFLIVHRDSLDLASWFDSFVIYGRLSCATGVLLIEAVDWDSLKIVENHSWHVNSFMSEVICQLTDTWVRICIAIRYARQGDIEQYRLSGERPARDSFSPNF